MIVQAVEKRSTSTPKDITVRPVGRISVKNAKGAT